MRTFVAKNGDVEQRWFIIDASQLPVGRMASQVAMILQGKNKPTYTPHVDTGDFVVVFNAGKAQLTGRKLDNKYYHYHTGFVGGIKSTSAREMMSSKPDELLRIAVKGMLPKTKLGRQMLSKLKIHSGDLPEHAYKAQKAESLSVSK
ncbi:MAG: 50S ribosomal protein L13 [Myxococcota bacterium]|jgi:large subunit ribosomal protein L13|nr:50S ribosomal protein L13 [Myxococcota bacterium]